MEKHKISSREEALKWWNNLDSVTQRIYANHEFNRGPETLTGREIEMIWNIESKPKNNNNDSTRIN